MAETLFGPDVDPTGQVIRIRNQPFKVVGVMASKGTGAMGNDQDDVIFSSISTGLVRLFGKSYLSSITIKVSDAADIAATQERAENLLRERHRTEDFSVRNMSSYL